MKREELIMLAKDIATTAHKGQFRRDGVTPYISHPAAVAHRLRKEPTEVVMMAWLHDVMEDAGMGMMTLGAAGVPLVVREHLVVLTKFEDESYEEYLTNLKLWPMAVKVKVADMLHNLSDDPTENQIVKYAKGLQFLLS